MTVFSLSLSRYAVAPPTIRKVESTQHSTVPKVRSQVGITIRNRDHASHAQNNTVGTPRTSGPVPQSNCNHMPGSVIHGRYTRRLPALHACFASATARRVVRSEPSKPIATIRSCTLSARILASERSTSSSIFSRHGSMTEARSTTTNGSLPAARACT